MDHFLCMFNEFGQHSNLLWSRQSRDYGRAYVASLTHICVTGPQWMNLLVCVGLAEQTGKFHILTLYITSVKQHILTVLIRLVSSQLLVICVTVWYQPVVCQVLGLNMREDATIQMAPLHISVINAEFWRFLCVNLELSHHEYFWENIKASLHFLSLSNTKVGSGGWNPSLWKTRIRFRRTLNIMTATDLATQEARTSTVLILNYSIQNMPVSAQRVKQTNKKNCSCYRKIPL